MALEIGIHVPPQGWHPLMSDLLLIHGWGMHCGVFASAVESWKKDFRVLTVDLPGHGFNHAKPMIADLPKLADQIINALDETVPNAASLTCLGWSLGGQLAMQLATRHPERVSRLALVAATPRFVAGEDWAHGMPDEVFASFAAELEIDHEATWRRFLALEAHGASTAKHDLRKLQSVASEYPPPSAITLASGLELLRTTDLRLAVASLSLPTLVVGGSRDRLVPPAALSWLAEHIPDARLELMAGCGHAPFVGNPDAFSLLIRRFANQQQPREWANSV